MSLSFAASFWRRGIQDTLLDRQHPQNQLPPAWRWSTRPDPQRALGQPTDRNKQIRNSPDRMTNTPGTACGPTLQYSLHPSPHGQRGQLHVDDGARKLRFQTEGRTMTLVFPGDAWPRALAYVPAWRRRENPRAGLNGQSVSIFPHVFFHPKRIQCSSILGYVCGCAIVLFFAHKALCCCRLCPYPQLRPHRPPRTRLSASFFP